MPPQSYVLLLLPVGNCAGRWISSSIFVIYLRETLSEDVRLGSSVVGALIWLSRSLVIIQLEALVHVGTIKFNSAWKTSLHYYILWLTDSWKQKNHDMDHRVSHSNYRKGVSRSNMLWFMVLLGYNVALHLISSQSYTKYMQNVGPGFLRLCSSVVREWVQICQGSGLN